MYKLFYLFIISAGLFSAPLFYNTTISKKEIKEVQEKFDGVSKATKPKKDIKLYS